MLRNSNYIIPAIKTVENFGKVSGLKLNINKTKALLLGRDTIDDRNYGGISFVSDIKCLGVFVGKNKTLCEYKNWNLKFLSMEKMIQGWRRRHLTLMGKICIIKSLLLSIITFSATNTYIPGWVVKHTETIFYNFIWGNIDKVKRNTVIGDIQLGLHMIDIETYFFSNQIGLFES